MGGCRRGLVGWVLEYSRASSGRRSSLPHRRQHLPYHRRADPEVRAMQALESRLGCIDQALPPGHADDCGCAGYAHAAFRCYGPAGALVHQHQGLPRACRQCDVQALGFTGIEIRQRNRWCGNGLVPRSQLLAAQGGGDRCLARRTDAWQYPLTHRRRNSDGAEQDGQPLQSFHEGQPDQGTGIAQDDASHSSKVSRSP
jgi:hypothetical protein